MGAHPGNSHHPKSHLRMAAQAALSKVHKTSLPSFAFVSPVGALAFVLVQVFVKHFLQGFSETVGDTPGKTKMVLPGAWF